MKNFIAKLILTFFIACMLVQCGKSSIFAHNSVAKYHAEFINGDVDSVFKFQTMHPEIVKDKYVYIAYLHIYCNHELYRDLLKSHLQCSSTDRIP